MLRTKSASAHTQSTKLFHIWKIAVFGVVDPRPCQWKLLARNLITLTSSHASLNSEWLFGREKLVPRSGASSRCALVAHLCIIYFCFFSFVNCPRLGIRSGCRHRSQATLHWRCWAFKAECQTYWVRRQLLFGEFRFLKNKHHLGPADCILSLSCPLALMTKSQKQLKTILTAPLLYHFF